MMRITLFCCLFLLVLTSCRKEDRVDHSRSPFYYYSEDGSKVLYDTKEYDNLASYVRKGEYKEVTTDIDSFIVLHRYFGRDTKKLYYKYRIMRNVDHLTFEWDYNLGLPKDKKHLYFPVPAENADYMEIIKDADPDTYERVFPLPDCLKWYRDKNYYFYNHKRVNADRETLSFDAPYLPFDHKNIFSVENDQVNVIRYQGKIKVLGGNLIRDSLSYYFNAGCDSTARKIDYKDPDKFEYYDSYPEDIFRIDNLIYIRGLLFLKDVVDVNTFEVLDYSYYKDKNHVYYKESLLQDADPVSFELINMKYAKDKNHVFGEGKLLSDYKPDDFVKDSWGRYPADEDYGKEPKRSYRSSSRDDD